jgi:hypothetical protein
MSFIVPLCVLLLALLVGIVLDDPETRRRQEVRRDARRLMHSGWEHDFGS